MRRFIAITSLACAWLCANGALWDTVQVVAWARMFAGYAETMSVSAALQKTLDPTQACEMCVGVAKAKDTAQKQLPPAGENAAAKFLLALNVPEKTVFGNDPGRWPPDRDRRLAMRTESVPLRPPRA